MWSAILLAEQRAAVTAGAREVLSHDAEQKLALVTEDVRNCNGGPVVVESGPAPPPVILQTPAPNPPPDLRMPIALIAGVNTKSGS